LIECKSATNVKDVRYYR